MGLVRRVSVLTVVMLLASVPVVSADDVPLFTQDDAGSGRDAPDVVSDEVPIVPGVVYSGMSTGPFVDDYDVYAFTGEAGQRFSGWADGNLGCYHVSDQAGAPLQASACSYAHVPVNTGPVEFTLPYTGTYHFHITHLAPVTYEFSFVLDSHTQIEGPVPNLPVVDDDAGSGQDAPNGPSIEVTIEPDVVYNGTSAGFLVDTNDVYHFVGPAGATFRGWVDASVGCYRLLDASGEQLGESACSYSVGLNTGPLTAVLPYTGDYFLSVGHLAASAYRFGFTLSGLAPDLGLGLPDPIEQDDAGSGGDAPDQLSTEIAIEPDVVYEGTTTGFGLDSYDVYHFVGVEGQRVRGFGEGLSGCLRVLDRVGDFIGEAYCSYAPGVELGEMVAELPYTGDFFVQVQNAALSFYRFSFTFSGASDGGSDPLLPDVQDDAGSGHDAPGVPSNAITIQPDRVYNGTSPGPVLDTADVYHFTAEEGDVFRGWPGAMVGCYSVVDVNDEDVGDFECSYSYVGNAPLEVVIPYSGDFYFRLGHTAPSSYRFGFSLTGAPPEVRPLSDTIGWAPQPEPAPSLPIPEGCHTDSEQVSGLLTPVPRFTDACYHMRTNLNTLDTPNIDVLIVPPVSTYPERDVRVMRQAIEMWETGIHTLAREMGMDWLDEGVDIDIFVDDDHVRTDPLWDPEIVVVATNPAGGAGIGTDPLELVFGGGTPCHGQPNPLAGFEDWLELPGFDQHHDGNSGTYSAQCDGGGSICYAINGAIDPVPGEIDFFGLYDLVAHEVGHCLTIGHVGDALDHEAEAVPDADIMAYTDQPFDKCVSTLDVEAFAVTMSRYLLPEPYLANDAYNEDGSFQIQRPEDHWYASPTGRAEDCPQPDAGLVPGLDAPTVWEDDDAGSGQDAPGVVSMAVSILPGVRYEASSRGPVLDSLDVFHFTGTAGDLFQGIADGQQGCYELLNDAGEAFEPFECDYGELPLLEADVIRFELPYTGDYYFRVDHLTPAEYRLGFTLDGSPPPDVSSPLGANGVQDDAGSGRDAPNEPVHGVTLEPDVVYHGMMAGLGTDGRDYYHFVGEVAQTFRGGAGGSEVCYALVDETGQEIGDGSCSLGELFDGDPIVVELPYSGDYFIELRALTPGAYRVGFALDGPPPAVDLWSSV